MLIKQLSVFLENKTGRLADVARILGSAGINMTAFTIADTSDFGILRVIVSEPEKALEMLKANDFSVQLTNVIGIICPNQPGALSKALQILSDEMVVIEYLYAFSMTDSAVVVIKPADIDACIAILKNHQLELIAANDLYKI